MKHIPLRRCVGCMKMFPQETLVRVNKSKLGAHKNDNKFELGLGGGKKKPKGRGAYICRNAACFEAARKKNGFERSFKCAVPAEIYNSVLEQISGAAVANE